MDTFDENLENASPPNTVSLQADLARKRVPFSEIQRNLSFNDTPEVIPKNTAKLVDLSGTPSQREEGLDGDEIMIQQEGSFSIEDFKEVLAWKNPAVSALVFLVGGLTTTAVEFALRGNHGITLLSGLSYALLFDLALNFCRSLVSARWRDQARWCDSGLTSSAVALATEAIRKGAELHDHFLSAKDPQLTLRVAAMLWTAAVLGRLFSIWRLVTLAFLLAFTAPLAYNTQKDLIRSISQKVQEVAKDRWEAMGLSRRQKAVSLAIAFLALWANSGWATRSLTLFLVAIVVRCNLKPAEVDAIAAGAEPYIRSTKKRAKRLSIAAGDFVRRHSVGGAQMPPKQPHRLHRH